MVAVGHSETVVVTEDHHCWGTIWLPVILEAIGGFDGNSKVYGISLHAEYGQFATATILHGAGGWLMRVLPHYGTNWLSSVLNAPRGLQAITLDCNEDEFIIAHCRYAPIDMSVLELCAALKVSEDGN